LPPRPAIDPGAGKKFRIAAARRCARPKNRRVPGGLVALMQDAATWIGLAAGFLTTSAFVPQVWKIWKTKSARDVSLPAFVAFAIGVAMWTVFGVLRGEPAITIWNSVTLVLAIAILVMKLRYQ
jgi:MtN3 and saliva related transmembrane protein